MNNNRLLNLINLKGGANDNEIIKIANLNNMIDDDSTTSDYTVSYLDAFASSDIDGGKGKGPKSPKSPKGPKSPKSPKSPKKPKASDAEDVFEKVYRLMHDADPEAFPDLFSGISF